jgi:hypothetical protein
MKPIVLTIVTGVLLATILGIPAIAVAQEPATNQPTLPPSFRTPLIRDMELIDQVKALSARVATLETKNADLAKKLADLEAKLATAKK